MNNMNNTNTMQVCKYQELSAIFYFSDCPLEVVRLIYEYKQHMESIEKTDLMVLFMMIKNKNNTAPNSLVSFNPITMKLHTSTTFRNKVNNKLRTITMCIICGNYDLEMYVKKSCAYEALCFCEHGF